MRALERVVDALRDAGQEPTEPRAGQWRARCPAHGGTSATSLSVHPIAGQVLVHCFAECETADVVAALNLGMADLFDEPRGASYRYGDGRVVHRSPDKRFRQSGNTSGRPQLFRLGAVRAAVLAGQPVYVVEGEKDVLALESVGVAATCCPMGAGKWSKVDDRPLHGATVIVVADKDTPGRKHAAEVAASLAGHAEVVVVEALVGKDAADHVAAGHDVAELLPVDDLEVPQEVESDEQETAAPALAVTRLSDVVPERVRWLWDGRLPIGKMVVLDGDPGLGKSTVAAFIAGVVTTGGTWPDGTTCEHTGDVVLLAAEDGLADTIRPRLDAVGADCSRVHAVEGVTVTDEETGERYLRPPTLADVNELHRLVVQTSARLVVIDVLMAYLPTGVDSHRDQDVRRVLSRLAAMAEATGCTVLLLRHLNKAKGGDPMYRGGGSIGIVGAVRSGLLVAADPDDPELRVMVSIKSNLGPPPAALTYRLVSSGGHGAARVEWEGTSVHDARTLLADRAADDGDDDRSAVVEWLRDLLEENGCFMASKDIYKRAAADGFSVDQAKRAKSKLHVKAVKGTTSWGWQLPEEGSAA